jgi:hypothetical protein
MRYKNVALFFISRNLAQNRSATPVPRSPMTRTAIALPAPLVMVVTTTTLYEQHIHIHDLPDAVS